MLVVSDTSPLRALQTLGRVALIEQVYGRVFVPPAVAAELAVAAPVVGSFESRIFPS